MAIIYSYPTVTPELQDLLVGAEMAVQGGEDTPRTRTFTIESIVDLVQTSAAPDLQQVTTAGSTTTVGITATTNEDLVTPISGYNSLISPTSVGVIGQAATEDAAMTGGIGVYGSGDIGVSGYSTEGYGVYARSLYGAAINASGASLGVWIQQQSSSTGLYIESTIGQIGTAIVVSSDDATQMSVSRLGVITATKFINSTGVANSFLMANGDARVYTVTNSTQATNFTAATLNAAYPTATIGFTVQCTNAAVLKSYQKTATGWISSVIVNVV